MKFMKALAFSICMVLIANLGYSQRGHRKGKGDRHGHGSKTAKVVVKNNRHHRNRVVVRSPYRPAKIVVYHPHWRPNYEYHRRWVYFPRYNFYWDNWRQGYCYRSGAVWTFNATPPAMIVNVNLEKEPNYELKEDDDDIDDVYRTNETHIQEFKTDSIK